METLSNIKKNIKGIFVNYKFKKILNKIPQKNITDKVFVFNTIRTFNEQLHRELFLAYTLAKLGATVYVLIDKKGCFYHWEHLQKHNEHIKKMRYPVNKSFLRFILYKHISNIYFHENIKIIDYSKIIDKNLNIQKVKNENIDLEKSAQASTRRYTETGEIDFSDESHKRYYENSLQNANISLQMGKFIKNKIKPDVFVTSHGVYSLWGPCFQYMVKNGVRSLIISGGVEPNSIRIIDEPAQIMNKSKEWEKFKSKVSNQTMEKIVKEYLDKRRNHKTEDNIVHFKYINKNAVIDTEKSRDYDYVFCAFPNVIWDGDINERNHIFNGVLDWLVQTISFIKNKKNLFLYIRCHPSEVTMFKGTKLVEDLLSNKIEELENIQNVEIISSKTNLDTYHFLEKYIDIGLVYDGTLGLEIPFMGIPTLMAGNGRTNIKGINIGVKTLEQYFNYLSFPKKIKQDFEKSFDEKTIYKYIYWNQFDTSFYMPILDKNGKKIRLDNITISEVNIWDNHNLKRTIVRLLGENEKI